MAEIIGMIAVFAVIVFAVGKWVDGIEETAEEWREHMNDNDYWDFP